MNAPRVLVTGGAGYLGSVVCEHLLDAGYPATSLSFRYYFDPPGQQVFITLKHQWSRAVYRDTGRHVAGFLAQHRFERAWLIFSEPVPEGSVAELVDALRAKHYVHGPVGDFRLVGVTLFTHPNFAP